MMQFACCCDRSSKNTKIGDILLRKEVHNMIEGMWLFWDILVCVLGVGVKHRIQNNGFEGLSTKLL